jgi:hypothetical protein
MRAPSSYKRKYPSALRTISEAEAGFGSVCVRVRQMSCEQGDCSGIRYPLKALADLQFRPDHFLGLCEIGIEDYISDLASSYPLAIPSHMGHAVGCDQYDYLCCSACHVDLLVLFCYIKESRKLTSSILK